MEYSSLVRLRCNKYFLNSRLYKMQCSKVKRTQLHWHEFYEIEYVVSGHAVQTLNGVSYSVGPGTLTFLSPVDFHAYHDVATDKPLVVYKVIFQDVFLPKLIRDDIYAHKGHKVAKVTDPAFKVVFRRLYREYSHEGYASDIFMMNGIINLCIMTMRALRDTCVLEVLERVEPSPIQDAIIYVHTHFRENISVEMVAQTVHLSPNYFSEYFKKQTGEKFSSYLLRLRLEYAANLLRVSDLSVKEIAYESGFNSVSYFSNTFKGFYQTSPEHFRRDYRIDFKPIE